MSGPALPIGALVLIGSPRHAMPHEWWPATVLWTDGAEVLVHQGGIAGASPHNQLHPIDYVRAVGDSAFLNEFQRRAAAEVEVLAAKVPEAELALGRARQAVWTRLSEIGADVLGLEASEQRADRRCREKARDACLASDMREERRKAARPRTRPKPARP